MRCPKCYAETANDALCCPKCKLPTPKGTAYKSARRTGNLPRQSREVPKEKTERNGVNPIVAVVCVLTATIVFGVGGYVAMVYMTEPSPSPNDPTDIALEKLRRMPSSRDGLTIEQFLQAEVERSRETGRLLEIEGWDVRPFQGNAYLVSFSYEEQGNQQRLAQWEVDIRRNTIVPKSDLAEVAHKK